MSKHQKPCLYEGKALDNQWMNLIYNSHDLFCGCLKPIKHLQDIVQQQECRHTKDIGIGTADHGDDKGAADYDIDAGDLEELFKDDTENDG